jgi:peptidoglycan-associated lipoprotein
MIPMRTIGAAQPLLAPARRLVTLALLTLAACGPSYPNCDNDGHCKQKGEYCLDRKCVACRTANHCPNAATDACVDCVAGACVRKAGCCSNNLDCASGQKCSTGKCVAECSSDADCLDGKTCSDAGACVRPDSQGCASDSDCGGGLRCQQGVCRGGPDGAGPCELVPVSFDFNTASLTREAQNAIAANGRCLKERGVKSITIEGHCDERGTDAYNLELGNRRAAAVKRYLGQLAGKKLKVRTVSFGKTRPLCSEASEGCWSRNRRAEFIAR